MKELKADQVRANSFFMDSDIRQSTKLLRKNIIFIWVFLTIYMTRKMELKKDSRNIERCYGRCLFASGGKFLFGLS